MPRPSFALSTLKCLRVRPVVWLGLLLLLLVFWGGVQSSGFGIAGEGNSADPVAARTPGAPYSSERTQKAAVRLIPSKKELAIHINMVSVAAILELSPDQTEALYRITDAHWQKVYDKLPNRIHYVPEQSDPAQGIRCYAAPAFPDEAAADLEALRADLVAALGDDLSSKAMECLNSNRLTGSFGTHAMSILFDDEEVPIFADGIETGKEVKPVIVYKALAPDGTADYGLRALQSDQEAIHRCFGTAMDGK